jgi:hypothetical protein
MMDGWKMNDEPLRKSQRRRRNHAPIAPFPRAKFFSVPFVPTAVILLCAFPAAMNAPWHHE